MVVYKNIGLDLVRDFVGSCMFQGGGEGDC